MSSTGVMVPVFGLGSSTSGVKGGIQRSWNFEYCQLPKSKSQQITLMYMDYHFPQWTSRLIMLNFELCCSVAKLVLTLFVTPLIAVGQASLSLTSLSLSWSLLKLMSSESVMPSNHLILCCFLLLPSIFPSIRVFSSELALCIRWPKCWSSASASVLPVNIQSWFPLGLTGLISLLSEGL